MTRTTIVQRVWNYCNTLRDDGLSFGDYVEQLIIISEAVNLEKAIYESIAKAEGLRPSILKQAFERRLL